MGTSKIWRLVVGAVLATMAGCALTAEPRDLAVEGAQASELAGDDEVAPLGADATTDGACVQTIRQFCTTAVLCENGDGVINSNTCPNGRICCIFHPNNG